MKIDIHQHFWTEPLLAALSERSSVPYARSKDGSWLLHLGGEADSLITADQIDPTARLQALWNEGVDAAVVALSSPAGIEDLPVGEAQPLLDAHLAGVRELPAAFRHWGVSSVWRIDPDVVDAQLDAGAVGLSLPAGALSAPEAYERVAPLLDRLEKRGAPLFVHPGPGPFSELAIGTPKQAWWPAMTRYVAEMNAAWHAFVAVGRSNHPLLKTVFAMLAGLAPLHTERFALRGGPATRVQDPMIFYDTSSYGARAISAMAGVVGEHQLVYGSDSPVVDPAELPSVIDEELVSETNPGRLLGLGVAL
jgi:predicted TIM-barrel fold metal-dependent hydrolase